MIYDKTNPDQLQLLTQESYPVEADRFGSAYISGKCGGTITKKELLSDSILHVACSFGDFTISDFKFSILRKGKDPVEYDIKGNKFSTAAKEAISTLMTGDKVFFEYINGKLIHSDDKTRTIFNAFMFSIAEK